MTSEFKEKHGDCTDISVFLGVVKGAIGSIKADIISLVNSEDNEGIFNIIAEIDSYLGAILDMVKDIDYDRNCLTKENKRLEKEIGEIRLKTSILEKALKEGKE